VDSILKFKREPTRLRSYLWGLALGKLVFRHPTGCPGQRDGMGMGIGKSGPSRSRADQVFQPPLIWARQVHIELLGAF
jgi:hypothetical protein